MQWSGSANVPGTFLGRLGAPWPMSRLRIADATAEVSVRPFGPSVAFPLDGSTTVTPLFRLPRTRGVLLRYNGQWSLFSAGRHNDDVLTALRQAGARTAERPAYREFVGLTGHRERRSARKLALQASPFVVIGAVEAVIETPLPWPW